MSEYDIDLIVKAARAAVVAAAGCGKTQTIVNAVARSPGLQLVLTHTHAGVDSLISRFKRLAISHNKYHVETIASFATRYTEAYPVLSGWIELMSGGDVWNKRYEAMHQLLRKEAVREVIRHTYSGMYVDEYQDCSIRQHFICDQLASIIPCRVFGDPLQSIFGFGGDQIVSWDEHVIPNFERLPELTTPWRWCKSNNDSDIELGAWLIECRQLLLYGKAIDLRTAPSRSVIWIDPNKNGYRSIHNQYYKLLRADGTVMVIMDQANQCHSLARSLSGKYQSMEEMDSRDLKEYTNRLGQAKNYERVDVAIDFAIECMTETTALKRIREAFIANKKLKPELLAILKLLADSTSFNQVATTLDALAVYSGGKIFRKELWTEMNRILIFADQNNASLEESMYIVRNKTRVIGRYMHPRMISRTLLVKGLEFDHVVIPNADKMSRENLYVALTRPTHTLTIVSRSPIIQPI